MESKDVNRRTCHGPGPSESKIDSAVGVNGVSALGDADAIWYTWE